MMAEQEIKNVISPILRAILVMLAMCTVFAYKLKFE